MEPAHFALTFDVDADANVAATGRISAVSAGGDKSGPSYEAATWGTMECLRLCEQHGIPSTWFLEAQTAGETALRGVDWAAHVGRSRIEVACHSLAHEDFSGRFSGIRLARKECIGILDRAGKAIERITGSKPIGFRAPYNAISDNLIEALAECGYAYDSSIHQEAGALSPFEPGQIVSDAGSEVCEVYLPGIRDSARKLMRCYLWPYFEGKRLIEEYLWFVKECAALAQGGIVQLALHPWHIAVSAEGQYFDAARKERHLAALDWLIENVQNVPDLKLTTIREFLGQ